jgi:hypothetical protein
MLQKGFSFCHINATIRKEHLFPFIQIMGFFVLCTRKVRQEEHMKAVKALWNKPATQWVCKTLYYFSILLGLLWLYGFTDTNTSTFIYNEF